MISQLIGLLVSMLALLSCVVLHKSLMQVSVQAKSDALLDRQIASAMMQMQYELHNAGMGMVTSTANDIVAVAGTNTNNLYWRYAEGGVYQCAGIREEAFIEAETQVPGRRFVEVSASGGCDATAALADLTWQVDEVIAEFRNRPAALLNFQVEQANCTPYGLGVSAAHYLVRIQTASSAGLSGASVTPAEYRFCLTNTHI